MTGGKFVFRQGAFLLSLGFSILLKAACESQPIGRRSESHSGEGRKDRLGPSLRVANAEIQSGSYFGCFDRSDAFDRVVFYRVVVVFIIALLMAQEEIPLRETASVR